MIEMSTNHRHRTQRRIVQIFGGIFCVIVLSICGPAHADGVVRVCIAANAHTHTASLPPLAEFVNMGPMIGDLTDAADANPTKFPQANYKAAFVLTEGVNLSPEKPCADVAARMHVDNGRLVESWPQSPASLWHFVKVVGYPAGAVDTPNDLGEFGSEGTIQATILSDLDTQFRLSDSEAAKTQPNNPYGHISEDLQIAKKLKYNARIFNFRICLADDLGDLKISNINIPKNTIFGSLGTIKNSIGSGDTSTDAWHRGPYTELITVTPAKLSKSTPCALVVARTYVGGLRGSEFPLERANAHHLFEILDIVGRRDGSLPNNIQDDAQQNPWEWLPGDLHDLVERGLVFGTPTTDIGDPLSAPTWGGEKASDSSVQSDTGQGDLKGGTGAGAANPEIIEFGKPIFTKAGAPICVSRDSLASLLEHIRAGVTDKPLIDYGCFAAPDGVSVTVLSREGIIDVWIKAVLKQANGKSSDDVWTIERGLRN